MSAVTRLVWDLCVSSPASPEGVREQNTFHAGNGCPALAAADRPRRAGAARAAVAVGDDVLFVLAGAGRLAHGAASTCSSARRHLVAPGERYEPRRGGRPARGPGRRGPEPRATDGLGARRVTLAARRGRGPAGDREPQFRLVVSPEAAAWVTQFVGSARRVAPTTSTRPTRSCTCWAARGVLIGDAQSRSGRVRASTSRRARAVAREIRQEPMQVLGCSARPDRRRRRTPPTARARPTSVGRLPAR